MSPADRAAPTLLIVCCVLALPACGGASSVYDVSGEVTFDGKPVPAGRIFISPDLALKNDGPQGFADIHDGKFDTRQGGRGAVSGPVVFRIEGYEKGADARSVGKRLFMDFEIKRELPKQANSQTLGVPASAGKNLPKATGPGP
jgi:hypothetical protein